MNKLSKIAISLIVVIFIGLGAFLIFYKNYNIINTPAPKEKNDQECDTNIKCFLTSTIIGCVACDYADSSWQCLSQEKSSEIEKKYQEYMNSDDAPSCAKCMPEDSPLLFRCICENGKCLKTSDCTNDNDCSAALRYARGGNYKCINSQCEYVDR